MSFMRKLPRLVRFALLGIAGIVALALIVALFGAAYNAYADARDRKRFPPPGAHIEVAGRKLHLHCSGPLGKHGDPTVVLAAGWGMPALAWTMVQPEIAKRVRVCSYDRVGLGYSDPDPALAPRPNGLLAEDLHALLEYGGVQPPYLLVGHSNGGYLARCFFNRHPKEVAGVVMVDSSSEYMEERFHGKNWQAEWQAELDESHRKVWQLRLFMALGLARFQLQRAARTAPFPVSQAVIDQGIFLFNQPKHYTAALAELDGVPQTQAELKKKGGLGELPLIVLTAGKFRPNGEDNEAEVQRMNGLWVKELQPQLAHLSTRGRQVIADSGHMIPFEAPHTIVKAVFEILDEAATLRAQEGF